MTKRNTKSILFITPLPPPVHGSAMVSQYIKDSALVQGEFECDFVNLSTSRRMDEIGKGGTKKLLRFVGSFLKLFLKLISHRYDLCYLAITCHGMGFLKDAPFVWLCKLFGCKVLIHQHNKGMSKCIDRWPYRWLIPYIYNHTRVMLLSWYLYTDIEKAVKREQVVICPNGIPETVSGERLMVSGDNAERGSVASSSSPTVNLLFLSNLIPSKGVYVLLDACKILKEKGMDFHCNFVGSESKEINRSVFEQAVRERRLDDCVTYHGPKYGDEKERYWEMADVFVQPTFEDCFPLTILEAMQHHKPIVSTNEGAVPDMVIDGENGFVCGRQDVNGLAIVLEKLITNPSLRKQMGEEGYRMYMEKFTLSRFEQRFVECLDRAVKG
ncbi:MAG: glycosyltransferase family 4 protein [Bacteroidaceae bacterium]|nr:glycosyltransferase family 4 protein [Bacteroidaceae bacterium]